jgi:hypothetical protein
MESLYFTIQQLGCSALPTYSPKRATNLLSVASPQFRSCKIGKGTPPQSSLVQDW